LIVSGSVDLRFRGQGEVEIVISRAPDGCGWLIRPVTAGTPARARPLVTWLAQMAKIARFWEITR